MTTPTIESWANAHSGDIVAAIEADDETGFCIACDAENGPVEPDARNYRCEHCGAREVFGAEELIFYVDVEI